MRSAVSLLAGALLALGAGVVVAAGAAGGNGRPAVNLHAHTDGHGHDSDHDTASALGPPRSHDRQGTADFSSPPVSLSTSVDTAIPAVVTPSTGGPPALTPPRPARRSGAGPALPGVVAPAFPGVTLIPPASLPAPGQFVPAAPGRDVTPILALAGVAVLLGGLLGFRMLRRPG